MRPRKNNDARPRSLDHEAAPNDRETAPDRCGVRVRLTDFPSNHTAQLSARRGQKTNQIANQNHNFSGCVKVWRPHMAAARKSFTSGAVSKASI
jgi:hypothetical protein